MNMALARAKYRQTDRAGTALPDDPHQVITVTLRELERSLAVLSQCATKDAAPAAPLPQDHISRALTALYLLQSSLDFEKGGDIALSLFQIYEYARLQVLALWRGGDDPDLTTAHQAIADISEAWQEIRPQVEPMLLQSKG